MEKNSFSKKLLKWYQKNKRDLPWRRTRDPYKIWISEIMLQQTTVNAVIPYYERWIKKYDAVEKLAKTPIEKVLKDWQGLGYYQRARNLHKAAQIVSGKHNGKLPSDPNELAKLPGFGPYTVGAVSSIAFGIKYPLVDANVRRVVMRFLAIEGFADTSNDQVILKFLTENLPNKEIGDFNQGLMELGALICKGKNPLCLACPVKDKCKAFKKGVQEIIPATKKKIIQELDVVIALIKKEQKYFIQKRDEKGLLAGLWEFPGGKIEKGESHKSALKRELLEEIGVELLSARHVIDVVHYYTQFKVKLHVYDSAVRGNPRTTNSHKWVSLKQMVKYPMPSGSARIVAHLQSSI